MADVNLGNSTSICDIHSFVSSRTLIGSMLIITILVGGTGNVILGIFIARRGEMQSRINIILATIAISDAFISLICAPVEFASITLEPQTFGYIWCHAHAFVLSLLIMQNFALLIVISIDRYFTLVHGSDMLKKCRMSLLLPCCFVIAAAISSLPLFGVGGAVFSQTHCKSRIDHKDRLYYRMFSIVFFFVPFSFLLGMYGRIILIVRKTTHRVRPSFTNGMRFRNPKTNFRFKRKTFYTILCLFFVFMVCKLPMLVNFLLLDDWPCPLPSWASLFIYLNSLINPFVYATKVKQYRRIITGRFSLIPNRESNMTRRRKRSSAESIYRVSVIDYNSVI
ncbi:high-affinity lysophosphatidic acid receptor-like [Uloborus diversus]|uniref:high-affinity lysophosphatidic acid receptor-like n=1 Tax=Uloborus diversus TaxID=327109 RepID=UPI00240973F2|nr:high-affinity lysophosphatidic acid receptor-like [Uloborus diversus]